MKVPIEIIVSKSSGPATAEQVELDIEKQSSTLRVSELIEKLEASGYLNTQLQSCEFSLRGKKIDLKSLKLSELTSDAKLQIHLKNLSRSQLIANELINPSSEGRSQAIEALQASILNGESSLWDEVLVPDSTNPEHKYPAHLSFLVAIFTPHLLHRFPIGELPEKNLTFDNTLILIYSAALNHSQTPDKQTAATEFINKIIREFPHDYFSK
ncbi:MAG: hypothetical protein GWP59_00770 [Chlamydiales bacterium]|nr:hypothetical protein [Chlamydiales bacterium]NCF70210.1 hypothetical protein [Chlamydiales bacterium]